MTETRNTPRKNLSVRVTFLGTGDAFGSGGRLATCIHVDAAGCCFLLDCGPSVLAAMRRAHLPTLGVDVILTSHLHGDHTGGIPFVLLEAQLRALRDRPLAIAGPPGIDTHVSTLMEALFPGFSRDVIAFPLEFLELSPAMPVRLGPLSVIAAPAVHSPLSNPLSLRIETPSGTIAYSGDTEWNESLAKIASGADLFICECFRPRGPVTNHLDHATLFEKRRLLTARRIVLVHMDETMLAHTPDAAFEAAYDGMVVEI